MKNTKKYKKGFTLVELIVVIAVVAILAGVSVGAYFGITESAKESRLKQEAEQLHLAIRIIGSLGNDEQVLTNKGFAFSDIDDTADKLNEQMGGWDLHLCGDDQLDKLFGTTVWFCEYEAVTNPDETEALYYTHFRYFNPEIKGKNVKVKILGNEFVVETNSVDLATQECGVHFVGTKGDHKTKVNCPYNHYSCLCDCAPCYIEGHYIDDGNDHSLKNTDLCHNTDHKYACECDYFQVPEEVDYYLASERDENGVFKEFFDSKKYYPGEYVECGHGHHKPYINPDDQYRNVYFRELCEGGVFIKGDYYYYLVTEEYVLDYMLGIPSIDVTDYINKTGWAVDLIPDNWENDGDIWGDKMQTSYGEILDGFMGYDTLYMDGTFFNCQNLEYSPKIPETVLMLRSTYGGCFNLKTAPVIPESVILMYGTFEFTNLEDGASITLPSNLVEASGVFVCCENLKTAPVIPNGVKSISQMFVGCFNLKTAPVIPESVENLSHAFAECYSLEGILEINAKPDLNNENSLSYVLGVPNYCVDFAVQQLTLTGTCEYLDEIGYTGANYCPICKGYCYGH